MQRSIKKSIFSPHVYLHTCKKRNYHRALLSCFRWSIHCSEALHVFSFRFLSFSSTIYTGFLLMQNTMAHATRKEGRKQCRLEKQQRMRKEWLLLTRQLWAGCRVGLGRRCEGSRALVLQCAAAAPHCRWPFDLPTRQQACSNPMCWWEVLCVHCTAWTGTRGICFKNGFNQIRIPF